MENCDNASRGSVMNMAAYLSPYATDLLGTILMIVLLLSGGWRIPTRRSQSRILLVMIVTTIIGCTVDAVGWIVDGRPGMQFRVLGYLCNTLLYSVNIVIGPAFITIIVRQIHEELPSWHRKMIIALSTVEALLLVINFFTPIVFLMDENNCYSRRGCYWVYIAVECILILYGLLIYLQARLRGRLLRFFPAWLFLAPLVIAMFIQSFAYGISLLWASVGISICGLILCLQQESIFLDKLTGVYNRYYLDVLKDQLQRNRRGSFAALMLDMNGFKEINDRFSHAEGDAVLLAVANILKDTVHSEGAVVRFAGDEFVVLLEHPREGIVEEYKARILAGIDAYNETSGKPYRLSAAVGGSIFDVRKDDISDFLSDIDHRMYADKKAYYEAHDRRTVYNLGKT